MRYLILTIAIFIFTKPAMAEIKYFSDPAYIEAGGSNPLQSLYNMAKKGDARAMYMMGDLYEKGKGGYSKNTKKAYKMFLKSAEQEFQHSFIRLAVLEKKRKNYSESYKWYDLAIKYEDDKTSKNILKNKLKELKSKMDRQQIKDAKIALKKWKYGENYKENVTRVRKVND